MKAMRYGCLPIAAAVGGLKDTISHGHNGFLYAGTSRPKKAQAFLQTIRQALQLLHEDRREFLQMQKNAMLTDFSWTEAAQQYIALLQA
jgi:starch synthase